MISEQPFMKLYYFVMFTVFQFTEIICIEYVIENWSHIFNKLFTSKSSLARGNWDFDRGTIYKFIQHFKYSFSRKITKTLP